MEGNKPNAGAQKLKLGLSAQNGDGRPKPKLSLIEQLQKLSEDERMEKLAAIIADDPEGPILSPEVAQMLGIGIQSVNAIPSEELPYIWLNHKRRLYSRRLVLEFMVRRNRRVAAEKARERAV